jgi:hypothetical protein
LTKLQKNFAKGCRPFESMDYDTDVSIFAAMMEMIFYNLPEPWRPAFFADVVKNHGGNFLSYANEPFTANSIITTPEALGKLPGQAAIARH